MKRLAILVLLLATSCTGAPAREFTVMVYNVENLFDLDGVSLFDEYKQQPEGEYGVGPVLNKLENIRQSLAAFNEGAGPEVILFQEFELDRTPFATPRVEAFLEATRGVSLEDLLKRDSAMRNLPSELLLLKYLEDNGLEGYRIAQPDPGKMETHTPHKNVVFSKFPVSDVRQRPMLDARDLLIVSLNVDGQELILLNNHWKSGASSAETEPVRVQNAMVVRAEVEAILFRNPAADVIIAGDLNSYYNHSAAFPELPKTGVNDVLEAHGYEEELQGLYNLWFELPKEERGSEVWRGQWGTLMQMILTPGLYDNRGIQYVDNSFNRLILPGQNVDSRWSRPIAWTNFGGGSGFSDHLPIFARFRTVEGAGSPGWMRLIKPSHEEMSAFRPRVDFRKLDRSAIPEISVLEDLNHHERGRQIGELFRIKQVLISVNPAKIRVGDMELEVYCPIRKMREAINAMDEGDEIETIAELADWRGKLQVVIQDTSWMKQAE